jgi:hypothetical protein
MRRALTGVLFLYSETGTEGGWWSFQDDRHIKGGKDGKNVLWSYEGLHQLEDGDHLTIYSKRYPRSVLWSGIIKFDPLEPYKDQTAVSRGMWINQDQRGVDREVWEVFFHGCYPAKLRPVSKAPRKRSQKQKK